MNAFQERMSKQLLCTTLLKWPVCQSDNTDSWFPVMNKIDNIPSQHTENVDTRHKHKQVYDWTIN